MTDFELLKDITEKVEGENLREMMIACVGYGNYMDVLPKILARKDLFQLGEQLQRKYLVSTLEDGTTTVNGIVFKTNDKGRALLAYRKHELKLR